MDGRWLEWERTLQQHGINAGSWSCIEEVEGSGGEELLGDAGEFICDLTVVGAGLKG